jgi:hypothetical protein
MVTPMKASRLHALGAAVLLLAAAALAWHGQPTPSEKWRFLAAQLEPRLTERQVYIDPAELMGLMHDDYVDLFIIDLRDERDWNLFHLWGAERIPPQALSAHWKRFANLGENGVIVFVGNDEAIATDAWKQAMAAASRPNAYILAGGINRWLREFSPDSDANAPPAAGVPDENLRFPLKWALGARHPASLPDPHQTGTHSFTRKVRLQKRVVKKGGCG